MFTRIDAVFERAVRRFGFIIWAQTMGRGINKYMFSVTIYYIRHTRTSHDPGVLG